MNRAYHIAELIIKAQKGELSPKEQLHLNSWLSESEINQQLFDQLKSEDQQLQKLKVYQMFNHDKAWSQVSNQLVITRTISFSHLLKYAASILLPLLMVGAVFYYFLSPPADPLAGIDDVIEPGKPKAILILADGGQIDLDKTLQVQSLQQGPALINRQGTRLAYQVEDESILEFEKPIYNELRTPRGGTYSLQLADGTNVVLNAGSSLSYPVAFTDSTRTVYLKGEAYFDVATTGKPFIVSSELQQVRVLGTVFNIRAYTDDQMVNTTLVEGKVQVEAIKTKEILQPGQQSVVIPEEGIIAVEDVNTAAYTSWIQGKFEFTNDDLETVLRQLSRWYDFTYQFEKPEAKQFHFTGRMDSNQPISSILHILEISSSVKFEFKDNTILIK